MDFWKNKVAIVTGACHGIGRQISEDLTKVGMTVIGFEDTEEKVHEMFDNMLNFTKIDGQLIPCKCDVSNEQELMETFKGIVAAYGGVDLLINNAAIGKAGLISTGNIEDMKKVIDVNIFGFIACTRLAIASMLKKETDGLIININSICGHYMPNFVEPKVNMYIASKRTMTVLNKLLSNELKNKKHNITVTSISPGIVRTDIFKTAGLEFIDENFFENNPHLTVKDVSDIVLKILAAPKGLKIKEVVFHALHETY